jgi:serine/threonine protein phosphatase PrpC
MLALAIAGFGLAVVSLGIAVFVLTRPRALLRPPPPQDLPLDDTIEDMPADVTRVSIRLGSVALQPIAILADPGADEEQPTLMRPIMLVSAAGQTDVGLRRKRNEDRYLVMEQHGVFAVADGIGGHVGGDKASDLTVEAIEAAFQKGRFKSDLSEEVPRRARELVAAVQQANQSVWSFADEHREYRGMGTTLVAARFALEKERVHVAHVGDSRCYRFRGGELTQLTTDHTLGALDPNVRPSQADHLARAIGAGPSAQIDLIHGRLEVGDLYLLCTDGLTKMVPDEIIRAILVETPDLSRAVRRMIGHAEVAGGNDNITIVLVNVCKASELISRATRDGD